MDRYVRPSVAEDVQFIADHMRDEDVEEAYACGHSPHDALSLGLHASSPCYTLTDFSQTPIAMVGVSPSPYPDAGLIWMLGTKGIEEVKITFLKYSKPALRLLYKESGCQFFHNISYASNTVHHQWLKWLGFSFLRKVELPTNGAQFYEFARIKSENDYV